MECLAAACGRKAVQRGYCNMHRQRIERRGTPESTALMLARHRDADEPKACTKCKVVKQRTEFSARKGRPGDSSWCKACYAAWRHANPERLAIRRRIDAEAERQRARENPAKYIWQRAKSRAAERGLDFNLSIEDIVVPECCPALGTPMEPCSSHAANRPALDRIDNSRGYVRGNVAVISQRANRIKDNATAAELRAIADYIESALGK